MEVVAGPSSPLLAGRIASKLNLNPVKTRYKRFPDGELYVSVECKDKDVAVVQSLNSNDDLIFLLLLFDALNDRNITAVVPYMGYARQDRKFREGEALSIRAVAKLIEYYAERVISVNIHSNEAKKYFKNLIEVDAMPTLGEYFKKEDIVMISPDLGSFERVKIAAKSAGCEFDYLEKTRLDSENVSIETKSISIDGKNVVIIDDIISTGGTIVEAAKFLLKQGANTVQVGCVHAVLANFALNKIYSAGVSKAFATDTVEKSISEISVAELISEKI
jgi:ribose-phosphate pyrophosphokinase